MTAAKTTRADKPDDETPVTAEPGAGIPAGGYLAAIDAEYSQYRSTQLLLVNGVPAFAPGSAVPASHPGVAQWLADGMIERVGAE